MQRTRSHKSIACLTPICTPPTAISRRLGNLFRDAASNVSSCSTWQLTYKKLIHRFDAQASWQGNRWVISFFCRFAPTRHKSGSILLTLRFLPQRLVQLVRPAARYMRRTNLAVLCPAAGWSTATERKTLGACPASPPIPDPLSGNFSDHQGIKICRPERRPREHRE